MVRFVAINRCHYKFDEVENLGRAMITGYKRPLGERTPKFWR